MWNYDHEEAIAKSKSEKLLMKFMDKHFLSQYVDVKTRQQNILDLCLTNNDRLVHHVTSEKHELSDHNVIEIIIPHTEFSSSSTHQLSTKEELQGFNAIDLFKANYDCISSDLDQIDWDTLWCNSTLEEFPKVLQNTVLEVCQKHAPRKVQGKA